MMLTIQSQHRELCKEIIHLDHRIRFAGIINDNGRLVTEAVKDKIVFFVEEKDRDMLFMETALRTRMLGDFDSCLGIMNFSICHRGNVITMEFPIENAAVYVSSEKEINLNDIPFKIITLLRKKNLSKIVESKIHSRSSVLIQGEKPKQGACYAI